MIISCSCSDNNIPEIEPNTICHSLVTIKVTAENISEDLIEEPCKYCDADVEVSMFDSPNETSTKVPIENIESSMSNDSIFNRLAKVLPSLSTSNKIHSLENTSFIKFQNCDKNTSNLSLEIIFKEKSENVKSSTRATSIPAVDKCDTLLLSLSQIAQLQHGTIFNQNMSYLTLSMAKKLTVAALSGSMSTILIEIDNINYYLKTSWRAYNSHRKKKISNLKSRLNIELSYG